MRTPLFLFALTLILALACGVYAEGSLLICLLLVIFGVACFFVLRRFRMEWFYCALVLVFALGFGYGEWRESLLPEDPFYGTEQAELTGIVVNDPSVNDGIARFLLEADSLNGAALEDTVRVSVLVDADTAVAYGDELRLRGTFLVSEVMNPGGFDYREHQRQKGLYGTFSALYDGEAEVIGSHFGNPLLRFSYALKHRFERGLSYLPAEQEILLKGIFFGDTSGLDEKTADVLNKSGIRDAFAVSGLHVGYVLLFLNALGDMMKLNRGRRMALILPSLFLYAAMTGFSPSVLRASVMCVMVLGAGFFGRERNSYNGLGAAALLLLLWDPFMLRQAGFQLSFIAMFSILFLLPRLENLIPWEFPGKSAVLVTVAAQLGMIPVLAYLFHIVSFISFFIGTVCSLVVGGMVLLCFGALLCSLLHPFLGAMLLIPCGILGELVLKGAAWAVELPFAYIYKGDFGLLLLLLVYGILIAAVSVPKIAKRKALSLSLILCLFVLFLLPGFSRGDDLRITFLSVGQGDAIHIRTPRGEDWLIDAGDPKEGSVTYYTIRPYLLSEGISDIDGILLSHSDDDHSGAVPYLAEGFALESFVLAEASAAEYGDILAAAETEGSEVTWAAAGDVIDLGEGVTLEVLAPAADLDAEGNAASLVVKLVYGDFSVLFTGDAEGKGLAALTSSSADLSADILKIPHHGSKNSYDEEFYRAVSADAVVISVGKNSYGHPADEVVDYWERHYADVYRTDIHGAVTVTSDGNGYTVTPYRKN